MKRISKLAVGCASLLAFASASQAATQTDTFNVSIALTSYCTVTTVGTPITIDFGTYDAQTGTASTPAPSGNITMDCTRGLTAPTFALDSTDAARQAGVTGTVGTTAATGWGVLNGLNYALSIAGSVVAGTAPTASAGSTGTADAYTYAITGSMPGGQYGTCTGATCVAATHVRTLTVTY